MASNHLNNDLSPKPQNPAPDDAVPNDVTGTYDSIQLCMPDYHSVPRGKVVYGEFKESVLRKGFDFWNGTILMGPRCELPYSLPEFCAIYPSHIVTPCPDTLIPWPWVGSPDRQVGNVLCDMYLPDGSPYLMCPRQQLKHQIDCLWSEHGLQARTAFEYEFYAFERDSQRPLGSNGLQLMDLRVWGQHCDLFADLTETLSKMKVKVRMVQTEFCPGQWELTTPPYADVMGADVGFYVKNAIKGCLGARGIDVTFMTKPTQENISNGLHLNHSLWKLREGAAEKKRKKAEDDKAWYNVFGATDGDTLNPSTPLSPTALHWIAGILTHAPALAALQSPTLNCYRRLHALCAPSHATWGCNDRNATLRVMTLNRHNVYIENRLVSGAASPYLALAATLAAGRDGLNRKLQCPQQMHQGATELPRSLSSALEALEQNTELSALLGENFVRSYVAAKREVEVAPYEKQDFATDDDRLKFERHLYFATY